MSSNTAVLHSGLLARKGEARPSASAEGWHLSRAGKVIDLGHRREHAAPAPQAERPARRIELPRSHAAPATSQRKAPRPAAGPRRSVHTRVEPDLHLRLKVTKARTGRTQQDLVASALEAYLTFLGEDVLMQAGDGPGAGS